VHAEVKAVGGFVTEWRQASQIVALYSVHTYDIDSTQLSSQCELGIIMTT